MTSEVSKAIEWARSDLYEKNRQLQKAIAWERAKGALRELVAIDGSAYNSEKDEDTGLYRYQIVEIAVNSFIESFEYKGYNE